jgi:hypothetical protein
MFYKWFSYCFLLLKVNFVLLLSWSAFPSLGMFIIIKSSPALSKSLLVLMLFGGYLFCMPLSWEFSSFSRSVPPEFWFLATLDWFYVCYPELIGANILLALLPYPPIVIPIICPFLLILALL